MEPTRSRPRRGRIPGAVASVAVLLLAGCSDDGDDGATSSTTVAASTTTEQPSAERTSAGCEATPPELAEPDATGSVELDLEADGTTRTYRLAVPDSVGDGEPLGVIFDLHGATSNSLQQTAYSGLAARAPERGYVVITPDAIGGSWELAPEGTDDDFLMALLDQVEGDYCIDLDRVHATGISLGAWRATATACSHLDRFASIALVAEEVAPADCGLSVVAFHGSADRFVPYGEGADDGVVVTGSNAGLPGVETNMAGWAANAGCDAERDTERIEPDVERWIYPGCPEGLGVEFYRVDGGGHTWPGATVSPDYLGRNTDTIDATAIALDWFDAHPLPADG